MLRVVVRAAEVLVLRVEEVLEGCLPVVRRLRLGRKQSLSVAAALP